MRIQGPQLPQAPSGDRFASDLVAQLRKILASIVQQVNGVSEGQCAAITNATTAPPTTGVHQHGDFLRNSAPVVLGVAGGQYIVTGWTCVQAGSPGAWVETRSPIGT